MAKDAIALRCLPLGAARCVAMQSRPAEERPRLDADPSAYIASSRRRDDEESMPVQERHQ